MTIDALNYYFIVGDYEVRQVPEEDLIQPVESNISSTGTCDSNTTRESTSEEHFVKVLQELSTEDLLQKFAAQLPDLKDMKDKHEFTPAACGKLSMCYVNSRVEHTPFS